MLNICESTHYMFLNMKKDLYYLKIDCNFAGHQRNESLTLNVKNMETEKKQQTTGKPSKRILKAFETVIDFNETLGSCWLNPQLIVLSNCNDDSINFWVKCDSCHDIYCAICISIFRITNYSDCVEIMFTIHDDFENYFDKKTSLN